VRGLFAGPGWWGPTAGFFAGALVVSILGGPLLLGLLLGGAVALLWHPLRRNPPWLPGGRRAWRQRFLDGGSLLRRVRQLRRATRPPTASAAPNVSPLHHQRQAARFDAVFRVRCEVVTERLQVWHASDTGRAYEVLARDSYPHAQPGDEGWLSFENGRARIRPIAGAEPERLLN